MQVLNIKWTVTSPPLSAKDWYQWAAGDADLAEHPLEEKLALPSGTLSVLNSAFTLMLNRSTGWDLSSIEEKAPFAAAAQIYKRGVAIRGGAENTPKTSGHYKLSFHERAGDLLRILASYDGAVVCDENVKAAWPDIAKLGAITSVFTSEQRKSLDTVSELIQTPALKAKPLWIIIGGGVLCDVASFAAHLSSKRVIFVPTTLLAMADACVGGKTGVNYPPYGKNQVGSFYFPEAVFVSQEWLRTLPEREFLGGLAECLKHAILAGDAELLKSLATTRKNKELTEAQLSKVTQLKVDVVNNDPTEKGQRAILNLGHTLAHALEAVSQDYQPSDSIHHGEAVALGLVYATFVSQDTAGLSHADARTILDALSKANCLLSQARLAEVLGTDDLNSEALWEELFTAMQQDKKGASSDSIDFVLLAALGKVHQPSTTSYTARVSEDVLKRNWSSFLTQLP